MKPTTDELIRGARQGLFSCIDRLQGRLDVLKEYYEAIIDFGGNSIKEEIQKIKEVLEK